LGGYYEDNQRSRRTRSFHHWIVSSAAGLGIGRRLIAFSVGKGILAVESGKYRTRIQLRLVTRVFLTREIQHHRSFVDAGSASGQAGLASQASGKPRKKRNLDG